MDPNFALAHNQLGQAYLQKNMNPEAITELQKAVDELLAELKNQLSPVYSNASEIAVIYTGLGDSDQAMYWLQKIMKSDLTPVFCSAPDSIHYATIRDFRHWYVALDSRTELEKFVVRVLHESIQTCYSVMRR